MLNKLILNGNHIHVVKYLFFAWDFLQFWNNIFELIEGFYYFWIKFFQLFFSNKIDKLG